MKGKKDIVAQIAVYRWANLIFALFIIAYMTCGLSRGRRKSNIVSRYQSDDLPHVIYLEYAVLHPTFAINRPFCYRSSANHQCDVSFCTNL